MNPTVNDPTTPTLSPVVPAIAPSGGNDANSEFMLSPEELPNLDELVIEDGKPV